MAYVHQFITSSNKNTENHREVREKPNPILSYLFPRLVNLSFGDPHWPSWHLLPSLPRWSAAFFLPPCRAAAWFGFESSFGIASPGSLLGAVIWPPGWVDRWGSQAQEMEEEKEDVYIYVYISIYLSIYIRMPTAWGFPRPGRGTRLGGFGILVDSMAVFSKSLEVKWF